MKTVLIDSMSRLAPVVDAFPWEDRAAYGDWLAQTYYYVCHSTRLLAAAAARFAHDERGNELHHRFGAHLAEEKKHELLALHDLATLGFELPDFPERHLTRMFYEAQYYKVEHHGPMALFGYILPLEALAAGPGKRVWARVREAFGAPSATFLGVHAEDDVEHLEKAFAVLERATPTEQQLIAQNVEQSAYCYGEILRTIQAAREPSLPRYSDVAELAQTA